MTLQKDADRNELKFLNAYVDLKDKRVLEIGCGEARLTRQYAHTPQATIGLDLDRDALRVARADSATLADKISFTCADSTYLPFAKEKFDIALLAWSL